MPRDPCPFGKRVSGGILGRLDAARKAFEAASPADQRAHYGLATVYARLDEPEKSRRQMEEFRRLSAAGRGAELTRIRTSGDPLSPRDAALQAHVESGRVYLRHGNAEKAEDLWRKAAALDPKNVDCRTELADLWAIGTSRTLPTGGPDPKSFHAAATVGCLP
jgi:Tfp pilus assembly protein PilF